MQGSGVWGWGAIMKHAAGAFSKVNDYVLTFVLVTISPFQPQLLTDHLTINL